MPNKAYVIFLAYEDDQFGNLYFPIKRQGKYAGMPQFFGGTKNQDESDIDTIKRELEEESDGKISLTKNKLVKIHTGFVNGCTYNFYISQDFSGAYFLGDLKNGEMESIVKFAIQVGGDDEISDLLQRLNIVEGEEFAESETYIAFDKAIKWSEPEWSGDFSDDDFETIKKTKEISQPPKGRNRNK